MIGPASYSVWATAAGEGAVPPPKLLDLTRWTERGRWTREESDTSTAQVSLVKCGDVLGGLPPAPQWELLIERNSEPVWWGPAYKVSKGSDECSIIARDLSWWLDGRQLSSTFQTETLDGSDVVSAVLGDAFRTGPVAMSGVVSPSGVFGSVDPIGNERSKAGNLIRRWGKAGVGWTMVNRAMYVGDVAGSFGSIRLSDIAGRSARVEECAALYATDVHLVGKRGAVGRASVPGIPDHLRFCRVDIVEQIDGSEIQGLAESLLAETYPTPLALKMGSAAYLLKSSTVDVAHLIPGARGLLDLSDLGGERAAQQSTISRVSVQFSPSDERISVNTSPVIGALV